MIISPKRVRKSARSRQMMFRTMICDHDLCASCRGFQDSESTPRSAPRRHQPARLQTSASYHTRSLFLRPLCCTAAENVMPRVSIAFAILSMTCSSAFRPVAHPSSRPPAFSNAAAPSMPSIRIANLWSHGMLPSIRRPHQGRASVHMDLGLADTVLSSEALWTLVLTVRLHAPRPPSHTLLTSPSRLISLLL